MKDGIINGNGDSRFLKSAIESSTTWDEFRAMLIAGTAPIDLNGINEDGYTSILQADFETGNVWWELVPIDGYVAPESPYVTWDDLAVAIEAGVNEV